MDNTKGPLPIASHWIEQAPQLRQSFQNAEPFPLLVLDDFLDPNLADTLLEEFPAIDQMPKSRDYVFGNKHELSSVEQQGSAGARFYQAMLSDQFQTFLQEATGFDVFVDPMFFGGGFHQGGDGSFLDMHVDFNLHPQHKTWFRTLNILLYLNKDWKDDYGGDLLVKNAPDAQTRSIAPLFNRSVIMLTDDHTYHGYRKMSLPDGVTRKSIATYAYRPVAEGEVDVRTTGWVPESAGPIKRVMARNYNSLVLLKNRWLGSRTAKNR
ncbi:MAG TPA: 2OG-Fe(II) oxygenase [Acidimicrobiales bacterium]|nr:2OG-Fe(II) oxygenase [Acidimicrobiales bacterium]